MKTTSLHRTTQCHRPLSVGDAWLSVEHIYEDEGGKGAVVAYRDPSRPSPHGAHFLRGACIPLGERRELFAGVHVTIQKRSTHHLVKLRVEAPANVPVTHGFPRERGPRLAYSAA